MILTHKIIGLYYYSFMALTGIYCDLDVFCLFFVYTVKICNGAVNNKTQISLRL